MQEERTERQTRKRKKTRCRKQAKNGRERDCKGRKNNTVTIIRREHVGRLKVEEVVVEVKEKTTG